MGLWGKPSRVGRGHAYVWRATNLERTCRSRSNVLVVRPRLRESEVVQPQMWTRTRTRTRSRTRISRKQSDVRPRKLREIDINKWPSRAQQAAIAEYGYTVRRLDEVAGKGDCLWLTATLQINEDRAKRGEPPLP